MDDVPTGVVSHVPPATRRLGLGAERNKVTSESMSTLFKEEGGGKSKTFLSFLCIGKTYIRFAERRRQTVPRWGVQSHHHLGEVLRVGTSPRLMREGL